MAKRQDIRSILILGAGPIIIGQACEFDYSGSQACRALKEEGYKVILVNSNPATIMTDPNLADATYIEPLTTDSVTRIIETEKPDALLPTMGGQTALNIAFQLHERGVLKQYGVELIGANFDAIRIAEDREVFRQMVLSIGLDSLNSEIIQSKDEALPAGKRLGYPLILRPAFTLGGLGGSVIYSSDELEAAVEHGLKLSPIRQVLLEESALGWKEYEFEVMRDTKDNVVIVASVENMDPMGVHTGDSITVAPAQTLTDKEYQQLRDASIKIIRAVGVDAGGCNIQFAIHPQTGRTVVIEMNPRVSRSSALVSKATGVPIAKISAKLAVGLTLDEIPNDITKKTPASFEPSIDYVVTKIPRFSFEKFPGSSNLLDSQMRSVGEVMAIGRTFQESFQKALRGLETGLSGFIFPLIRTTRNEILTKLEKPSSERLCLIYQGFKSGISVDDIYDATRIDRWFLENLYDIVRMERTLSHYSLQKLTPELLSEAKGKGFSDLQIAQVLASGPCPVKYVTTLRKKHGIQAVFKAVDTCAGEFEAETPYYYSTYSDEENETPEPKAEQKRVLIIGGGPNRIGQGIEFDYCCVHAAFTLKQLGYQALMVNSNPETVSTDYDISDQLYFEPLTPEDIVNLIERENPLGVIAQLGGQTPLNLAKTLGNALPLLGTSVDSIDLAEDREKFGNVLKSLGLKAPASGTATSESQALEIAQTIGYPVIARPSYVLGGQAMRVLYTRKSLKQYLDQMIDVTPKTPVLIERFLEEAIEVDVDAVSDGEHTFMGGILEHIEHAGVHSGDSSCVWPAQSLKEELLKEIESITDRLAKALSVKGLLNIQFAIQGDDLYVLEVNPRASRTVPFIAKATGIPLIQMAVRVMLGETLADVLPNIPDVRLVAVKAPVFPFLKFKNSDPRLGPEMRSTGEVMGIDSSFPMAFAKAQIAAGNHLPVTGRVFISVNDFDKDKALPIALRYQALGFSLVATGGTAEYLMKHGLADKLSIEVIHKKHEGSPNAEEWIAQGKIDLVINTPVGELAIHDDSYIRKTAVLHGVPMATTLSGAAAMADAIEALKREEIGVSSLQTYLKGSAQPGHQTSHQTVHKKTSQP